MSRILQIGTATTEDPKRSDRCRRYGVKELSLFGSAARDESPVDSDIDPLVHCTLVDCFANGNQYALSDASTIEVLDFHARCSANRTLH
ncbi:MAG: nucleotidyltransferase domain-containing protein [Acidobacteria bacterium]|nr:nucleotidyltransferase domain-containing protein [Acidobacteriota bacterium]